MSEMPTLLELSGWEWFYNDDGGEGLSGGLGTVKIFGVSHHLEAVRVDGHTTFDSYKIELAEQICGDKPLMHTEIDGVGFVFLMTPFAD